MQATNNKKRSSSSTPLTTTNDTTTTTTKKAPRAIKRSTSLISQCHTMMMMHNESTTALTSQSIIYFDAITLLQYNLIIGQWIQISIDAQQSHDFLFRSSDDQMSDDDDEWWSKMMKKIHKKKVWAKIELSSSSNQQQQQQQQSSDADKTKKTCQINRALSIQLQSAVNECCCNNNVQQRRTFDGQLKFPTVHSHVNLLIFLSSAMSFFNVKKVKRANLLVLLSNKEDGDGDGDDDVEVIQKISKIMLKGLLRWVIAEQVCFVKNEVIKYEFCGRIFRLKVDVVDDETTSSKGENGEKVVLKSNELFTMDETTILSLTTNDNDHLDAAVEKQQHPLSDTIDKMSGVVPGYDFEVKKFCEYMFDSDSSQTLGGFRGVLLRAECGVGKSYFVKRILNKFQTEHPNIVSYRVITNELIKSNVGESEKSLRNIFMSALQRKKTSNQAIHVIVLEDLLDMQSGSRIEKLVGTELLYCMELAAKQNDIRVGLVAVMSNSDAIDSSFTRVDRLECDIELKTPSPVVRLHIFNALTNNQFIHDEEFQQRIAHETHGYVAADLKKLCDVGRNSVVGKDVYLNIIKEMKQSMAISSRLGFSSNSASDVKFADLAGIDDIVQKIHISILHPLTHREKYDSMGIKPPRGVLLRGPAGTGKTSLARAIANEAKANFVSVQCTDIISKVVGAPSRAISQLFNRARACSPCVLFFDQFEAIARARGNDTSESQGADQMLSTLLIEMDGVNSHSSAQVLVLAATNKPEMLDSAILRPGRFDQQIELRLPNHLERQQIVQSKLKNTPVKLEDYEKMAFEAIINCELNGLTPADLDNWCREAAMLCLREDINSEYVRLPHFIKAKNYLFPQSVE